ncbi:hypothetical protein Rhopal_000447-T1 [Rhodotorula paludigena]|uniref:non-specific serine/threonine protein kinase n=1 Tax=Rhodotorula paludigena TaxID=86838 RepID=A0AAV5GB26_9BASI|nr:hypothetical protein Rhopal_000447-T1 [Rhodotorula paludigena]
MQFGGFAHVYLAKSAVPLPRGSPTATTQHVLKRMVVPDKRGVEEVGREVEVMRQLKNHPKIVNMIEASVADLPGGMDGSKGYEIYILMEWCQGGGIIDMMNTRLQNRLTEGEILKIFSDVVEAVAHMHYQSPPLIHRDLKVENILLSPPQTYKLCDFGSTTRPLPREKVPTSVEGIQKIEHEINKTTTLQYRAPELVDVWGRKGFDEKIDIWALGVFLYKLCFYTTPFEEHGPLAILNAQYKFPPYPAYSSSIRSLIAAMLQERASQRPNIYQVHEMVCRLRGVPVRLENKYALSAAPTGHPLPYPTSTSSTPVPPSASNLRSPSLAGPPSLPQSPHPTASILSASPGAPPHSASHGNLASLAGQIPPMRRGRPGKLPTPAAAGAPQAGVEAERRVRTGLAEWHAGGERGEAAAAAARTPGGSSAGAAMDWEAFGGSASSPAAAGGAAASNGFGDAFAPPRPLTSAAQSAGLETSVELPSNAGMFPELSPQSLAALGGGSGAAAGPVSPMHIDGAGERDDERTRFEATFPALDDAAAAKGEDEDPLAAFGRGAGPSRPEVPSLLDAPSPPPPGVQEEKKEPEGAAPRMPAQLTGEKAESDAAPGPPLPRRPPTTSPAPPSAPAVKGPPPAVANKPNLVSRGSQTSPHLMASWKPSSSSLSSSPAPAPSAAQPSSGSSALRQSSIPELELSSSDAPSRQVLDLLGDEPESNLDALAPRPASRSPGPVPSPTPSGGSGNVASKRMSFLSGGAASQPGSPSTGAGAAGEREKFRPQKRMSVGGAGAGPSIPPKPSPKPSLDAEREKSVEERFPALTLEEPTPSPRPAEGEQWERLVEKEDADDSSDDEAPAAAAAAAEPLTSSTSTSTDGKKVAAPAFDDDDFAPRAAPAGSGRPRFGGAAQRKSSSALPPASVPQISTSPAPLEYANVDAAASSDAQRQDSYASNASSSVGDGGIDLGPALASIHKFAPQGTGNGFKTPQSLLDEQDDDFAPPPPKSASAAHFAPSPGSQPTSPLPSSTTFEAPPQGGPHSPKSPPPLVAPKPQSSNRKQAINSLVSRYEGLGTTLTGGPPPAGVKPQGLRKDSTGSSTGSGASHALHQRDVVQPQRLPQWGRTPSASSLGPAAATASIKSPVGSVREVPEDNHSDSDDFAPRQMPPAALPKSATPTSTSTSSAPQGQRVPFKPVPPPSNSPGGSPSLSAASGSSRPAFGHVANRPSFGGGGSMRGAPAVSHQPQPQSQAPGQDEPEERFAGVSNMKNRWESLSHSGSNDSGGAAAQRGGAGAAAKRRSWAQI